LFEDIHVDNLEIHALLEQHEAATVAIGISCPRIKFIIRTTYTIKRCDIKPKSGAFIAPPFGTW